MKKIIPAAFFICTFAHLHICTFSQSVGIGTTTPNPSAILDVSSSNKGILLPRMTTTQRNAIVAPVVGLTIFNLDDQCTDIFDGTNWIKNCGLKQGDSAVVPANNWIQKAPFGGTARKGATGFSIGTKGYIGTGYDGGSKNDFWEFDPALNAWTQKAPFGGTARKGATGFSIGTKGYIGTGYEGGDKNDFWEYDPTINTWTQKTNFGGTARRSAVGFSIGTKGYIGTGYGAGFKNDFWEFDPGAPGSLGTWTQKAPFGGTAREVATGFSIGTKGYIGKGYDGSNKNDFWEYDPATDAWTQKAPFGGTARYNAVGFSIGTKGYIGTGFGVYEGFKKDFWEYNTQPQNVASYSQVSNTLLQSNISDGIWTKTVLNDIISSGNKLVISKEGNVGIGTTTPSTAKLVIGGGAGTEGIDLSSSDQYANMRVIRNSLFVIDKDMFIGLGSGASSSLHLYSNNNETVTIKNGNVGIGNTDPNAALQFGNTVANRKLVLYDVNNNDHQFYGIGLQSGELRYQINDASASSHHRFYAGMSSTSSSLLFDIDGLGNAWLKGGLSQNSDARLKTNIHRIGNTLQNLQKLNGYTYNWLAKDRDQNMQTGLLAQEVQQVYPQLVKQDEKGILSVNYSGMVPVLLEAIKEQQAQINKLEKLVQQLINK